MDLLLDTHAFLWWDASDARLGTAAMAAIADPANRVFVSAATIWEIAIKSRKGKLDFAGSPAEAIERNGFLALPIWPAHAESAGALAWDHPDPFDRMLVAQAQAERMTLVHADPIIAAFKPLSQFWAR